MPTEKDLSRGFCSNDVETGFIAEFDPDGSLRRFFLRWEGKDRFPRLELAAHGGKSGELHKEDGEKEVHFDGMTQYYESTYNPTGYDGPGKKPKKMTFEQWAKNAIHSVYSSFAPKSCLCCRKGEKGGKRLIAGFQGLCYLCVGCKAYLGSALHAHVNGLAIPIPGPDLKNGVSLFFLKKEESSDVRCHLCWKMGPFHGVIASREAPRIACENCLKPSVTG